MSKKILIRSPNHLGDCILSLPMVNECREAYPGSMVTVLTPENLAEHYFPNPAIDNVLTIPRQHVHGMISVFKIKDIISPHDFDIGFILPPSFGAASGFKLAGIKERIGYIADGRRLLLTRPLLLPEPLNSEHRSKVYFDLLRRGSGTALEYTNPKLFLSEEDSRSAIELLDGFGITEETRYAVIAFRAVAESRRWGIDNYTELARQLVEIFELKVVLVGSAADQSAGNEIAEAVNEGEIANLAGKTSLRELAAICSGARVFVGNDSGPAHLAAAVETPLVVLSGADDPKETSPITDMKRLIYRDELDCISCRKNKCPLKRDEFMRCMTDITVDMVLSKIRELI